MLGFVQEGKLLGLPHSRPLPSVGPGCHELRIRDETVTWRIIYRVDAHAVLVCSVFAKKSARYRLILYLPVVGVLPRTTRREDEHGSRETPGA